MAANGDGWPPPAGSGPAGDQGQPGWAAPPGGAGAVPGEVWSETDPDERTAEHRMVVPSGMPPVPYGPAVSLAAPPAPTQVPAPSSAATPRRAGGKVLWGTTTDGVSKVTVGQRLLAGQSRTAPKGGFTLLQQPDGNLVLRNSAKTVVWSSGTSGHPGASTRMQTDGNLVIYDAKGTALWSTKTYGKAATYLLVQDDGSAVLYTAAKKAVWTSKPA